MQKPQDKKDQVGKPGHQAQASQIKPEQQEKTTQKSTQDNQNKDQKDSTKKV